MNKSNFEIFRVCSRGGHEYYHIIPKKELNDFPENVQKLSIAEKKDKYLVLKMPDCKVTLFKGGRMLIEDLPEGSDTRAQAIVEEIMG